MILGAIANSYASRYFLESFEGCRLIAFKPLSLVFIVAIIFNRMLHQAHAIGADAVIGMRYDATEFSQNATEVLAYGTAVKLANK